MGFKIYKRGQGYYTRMVSALVFFSISVIGCYALYGKLQAHDIWVKTLVPAGLCAGLGLFVYWLVNKPNMADFMIAAEGEVKKVSWSSRREIVTSTIVVIIVVTLMAAMLWVTDMTFSSLFMYVIDIY